MIDPTARYVIAADDRTRAGVDSARRNLRSLNQSFVLAGRGSIGMVGALGRFGPAGIVVTAAFMAIRKGMREYREVLEATAKAHPELQMAMKAVADHQATGSNAVTALTEAYEEQGRVLQDPSVMAAQKGFADWLLLVRERAVSANTVLLEVVGAVRKAGVAAGIFSPRNDDELAAAREGRMGRLRREHAFLIDQRSHRALDPREQTRLKALEDELATLVQIEQIEIRLQGFRLDSANFKPPLLDFDPAATEKARKEMEEFLRDIEVTIREFGTEASEGLLSGLKDFIQDEVTALNTHAEILRENFQEQLEMNEELRIARLAANLEWGENTKLVIGSIKDALRDMIHTGKLEGREFIRFLIAEFSSRQIFKALDAIGDAITRNLNRASSKGSNLLSFLGSLFGGIFGGGGKDGGSGSGSSPPPKYPGPPLARGTNFVPRDNFPALLHRGEAVIPAKYNPAAGGGMQIDARMYIDARGATKDGAETLVKQLPAIMDRRDSALEARIVTRLKNHTYE